MYVCLHMQFVFKFVEGLLSAAYMGVCGQQCLRCKQALSLVDALQSAEAAPTDGARSYLSQLERIM